MRITVDIIIDELDIRIQKLKDFEATESNYGDRKRQEIRWKEYESFKNWIKCRR